MTSSIDPDMSVRQFAEWARTQRDRCARMYGVTPEQDTEFLLMQALKLSEEAGELHDEVLAQAGYQRREKMHRYTSESAANEIADVAVCLAILADSLNIDLGKALASKIDKIEGRWRVDQS